MTAADQIRALADTGTPGPWYFNGYSNIGSPDNGYDAWSMERVNDGHTLEGRLGAGRCDACGDWSWAYTDATGDTTEYPGHGCRLYTEDYNRDPSVADVPAHHGDTAIGRRAEDAAKIVAAVNALPALADLIDAVGTHRKRARLTACAVCDFPWPCPTTAARDALVAALGVTA